MPRILVLHGPNLNLLGRREPEVYGKADLETINKHLVDVAAREGCPLDSFQSNAEHELVDRIQQAAGEDVGFIIINAAAYTHTSIALRDALRGVAIPFIEVHLSNVYAREPFRHHSYLADGAVGVISGLGAQGYEFAVLAACRVLNYKK
jgi:3-dehydroquinate dehydratase-2